MDFREYRSGHFGFRAWGLITLYLRLALGIGYLSAVADRLGWWGPPGTPQVAWGNFQNFLLYTAKLNPWFPHNWIPAVGVVREKSSPSRAETRVPGVSLFEQRVT